MSNTPVAVTDAWESLAQVWILSRRARQAASDRELAFMLVNDTQGLAHYRQAALWLQQEGAYSLSGVVQIEANAPYVLWLEAVCTHLAAQAGGPSTTLTSVDLPPHLAAEWAQWWPTHALWLRMDRPGSPDGSAGLLLLRDELWLDAELSVLREWVDAWWHAFEAKHSPRLRTLQAWGARVRQVFERQPGKSWWQQNTLRAAGFLLLVLLFPVRMSVLAPGELVPANPMIMRSPLDGVIDVFHVQPNQTVQAGQPLFGFDEVVIQARLDVALQSLATAETDYRQTSQMALADAKSKSQLALLQGKVNEKRAETDYLNEQLQRARVLSPQAGVVLMDDPAEWMGKPVAVGERILRIAALDDAEVEAWLPLADAIDMQPGAPLSLYLSASPLSPVSATLRYLAHDAVQRPDGNFAYRVRASLSEKTNHRVGLKGTVKLQGDWVPLCYWAMRRPLATARAYLGL
ncbi:secretion protein HylD [Limnohabitans sp. 2KL-17]|nr:HlyD family efflux transporter periplasmic adaptor subunit [Limnohabitans sp. 2KL-17]PUE56877.1 secretion protein HylD [Limnohabitans sp. 2KL-17]